MSDPCDDSATAALAAMASGRYGAEDLARACLARIAARDPEVRAWAALDPELWLRAARAADRAGRPGPLGGLPFALKDLAATRDWPAAAGSPIYAGCRHPFDAAVAALTRRAGGVIAGKTVTTEFACFEPGPTRNPLDPARTPGGSSSGSAAAVACGMVPFALGTQTAGSIVRPAAYCGIVGFKPTHGLVPATGIKDCAPSLDTVGVLARTVADCRLWTGAVTGIPLDPPPPSARIRLGWCPSPAWPEAEPAMAHAFSRDLPERASAAGFDLAEIRLPTEFAEGMTAQLRIMTWETARSLAFEAETHWDAVSPRLQAQIIEGQAMAWDTVRGAYALRDRLRAAFPGVLSRRRVSALVTPSVPGVAPPWETGTGSPVFSRLWTLLSAPSVQVPGLSDPGTGLPLGVQVVAPAGGDALALAIAERLQAALAG